MWNKVSPSIQYEVYGETWMTQLSWIYSGNPQMPPTLMIKLSLGGSIA